MWAVLAIGVASCGGSDGGGGTEPEVPRATSITITPGTVEFTFLGEVFTFTAQVLDQNGQPMGSTVTWSSSNPGTVSVSNVGRAVAVANGSATVTAQSGSATGSASMTVAQVATRVDVSSGDGQSGTVDRALADQLVALSVDAGGAPVPNASVTFIPDEGSGSVSATTVTSDASAQAATTWTLGTATGAQQVTAVISGESSGGAQFTATGTPGAAATFTKSSGDQQVAPVGTTLLEPIVVAVKDEFGNGVPGIDVTFAVTAGGGSVDPAMVATDIDGMAQTAWTMGAVIGAGGLSASTTGLAAIPFTATASEPVAPSADLTVGATTVTPANPTSLETVTIAAPITNAGNASTVAAFPVQLSIDAAVVSSRAIGPLAAGGTALVTFEVGPLSAGSHSISVVADPSDAIAESEENNNTSGGSVTVSPATSLTASAPITNVGAEQGVELLFQFELAASDGSIEFVLAGGPGNDDADMYVNYGDRPASRDEYQCISGAVDSNEACRFNAALPGTYNILIHAFSTFSGATLSVTTGLEVLPYNIELSFINSGTSTQNAAFTSAATLLEGILPFDVQDIDFSSNVITAGSCIEGQPAVLDIVDDLRIYVDLIAIDGPGGTLGSAGPCIVRTSTDLPIIGSMKFDTEDLTSLESDGALTSVILHEMLHVLGIGTLWERVELLVNPSLNNAGADTHFKGPLAIEAFDAAGGTSYTGGQKVPVENSGSEGSTDGHWRESVFDDELMTPFLNSNTQPLSAITIQSLADVGYRVDVSKADPYTRVFTVAAPRLVRPRLVDFRNDIYRGPLISVDAQGRVVEIIRR